MAKTNIPVVENDAPAATKAMDINRAAGEISLAVATLRSIHAITQNQQVGIPIDAQDFYVLIVDLVVRTGMRLEVAHNAIGEGLIGEFEYPIDGAEVPREVIYG